MKQNYLDNARRLFRYYKSLGDKTFAQLSDEDLFWQYNPESNSIAIIVKHLWGNMFSRWTDFLTTDGEKSWRNREAEFDADLQDRKKLLQKWEDGWNCLFLALDSLTIEDFEQTIYIRNVGHSLIEAIDRQLAHYAYHVGQIVFLGRMRQGANWQSLTIPRGASAQFNEKKFSQPKHKGHFTDDLLK